MMTAARFLIAICVLGWTSTAHAVEGGSGAYLLGLRGAGSGVTPPPGVFVSDQVWTYRGDIARRLPTEGGPTPASAEVSTLVNIPTLPPAECAWQSLF